MLREVVAGREMSEEEAAGRAEKGRVAAAVTAAEVAALGEAGLLSGEREAGAWGAQRRGGGCGGGGRGIDSGRGGSPPGPSARRTVFSGQCTLQRAPCRSLLQHRY